MRLMCRWLISGLLLLVLAAPLQGQDIITTGEDYFVDAFVSNTSPFVGEQVVYSFQFYTAVPFQQAPSYSPPSFAGFWRTDMGPSISFPAQVYGRFYTVTQLDMAIYPTYAGELIIEPASLLLPGTVFNESETLRTPAIRLQARPLPANAPEGFDGAVGQFNITATLDRQTLIQGEPVALRLTVVGTGNVEQLPTPDLSLPDSWRVYTNPTIYEKIVQEGVLVGEKTFEWLLAPLVAGEQPLPPITLHYFDPVNLSYRSASTGSVMLDIEPAGGDFIISELDLPVPAALPLKPITGSLSSSAGDFSAVVFWVLWLIPPAVIGMIWWWLRQQSLAQAQRRHKQQAMALVHAERRLRAAVKAQQEEGYRIITQAIFAYFGDKQQIDTAGLSYADLSTMMRTHGVNAELAGHLLNCLEIADRGIYAPGESEDVQALTGRVRNLLAAVDATWK